MVEFMKGIPLLHPSGIGHPNSWLVLLLGFLLPATLVCGQAAQSESESTGSMFPLMAWNWAPSSAAEFEQMRDCGLTVAGFVAPKDLDLCHAAGLKAIVSDPRTSHYDWDHVDEAAARKNVASLVAETGRHPALYGYYLRDEPGAAHFAGLGTVAALVRELAPGKWPYINLFPNYANAQQLGTPTYEEHLRFHSQGRQPIRDDREQGFRQIASLLSAVPHQARTSADGVAVHRTANAIHRRTPVAGCRARRAVEAGRLTRPAIVGGALEFSNLRR